MHLDDVCVCVCVYQDSSGRKVNELGAWKYQIKTPTKECHTPEHLEVTTKRVL